MSRAVKTIERQAALLAALPATTEQLHGPQWPNTTAGAKRLSRDLSAIRAKRDAFGVWLPPCVRPECPEQAAQGAGAKHLCRRHWHSARTMEAHRRRREAEAAAAEAARSAPPPAPTGNEVVSLPVRPWVSGRGGGDWLGVSTWPDQVRPTVAAAALPMSVAAPPSEWMSAAKGGAR